MDLYYVSMDFQLRYLDKDPFVDFHPRQVALVQTAQATSPNHNPKKVGAENSVYQATRNYDSRYSSTGVDWGFQEPGVNTGRRAAGVQQG